VFSGELTFDEHTIRLAQKYVSKLPSKVQSYVQLGEKHKHPKKEDQDMVERLVNGLS
jgi:acetyl-CoA carboxylase carboxyltransferase component